MQECQVPEKSGESGKRKKRPFWKIDKHMLPYKVHFFLYIGAMGALLPYHPTIGITRLKLGAGNLAVVFTVQQFLFIVIKPIIGYIADYFNNLKTMILILTIINAVLSYLLLVIPAIDYVTVSDMGVSQVRLRTNFCEVCHISNEIQKAVEFLPVSTDWCIQNETCCKVKNTQDIFAISCVKRNGNSSLLHDVEYKIAFESCSLSKSDSNRIQNSGSGLLNYSLNKSTTVLYIVMNNSYSLHQSGIMCPIEKKFTEIEKMNITLDYIVKSCYKYPHDKMLSMINTTSIHSKQRPEKIICGNPELSSDVKYEMIESDSFKTYQFWLFTLFLIISCACTSAIFTLSDTACHEGVQLTGADYGKQRAWGSVGWGLMAPFSGFLNDYTDNYLAAMILMTILCTLQTWNLYKMDLIKPQLSQNIMKDIKTVLSSIEFIAFDVGVLLNGMGIGIVWFYLAWFVDDIGGSRLLLGLAHTIQCFLGEMPLLLISGWLIKKIGHFNVVSLALMAHCVRFLSYSSLKNPWMILPIECLDGVTFGLFYAAMTSYGKLSSKPGTEATTQSLLCSTYEGLGAGLGCVIAGVCFDYYGGYTTFFYAGLCFAAATAINLSSTALLQFKKGSLQVTKEYTCENGRF